MKRCFLFFMLSLLLLSACVSKPGGETQVPTQSGIPAKPLPSSSVTPSPESTPTMPAAPGPVVWGRQVTEKDYTASDGTVIMTASFTLPAIENPDRYAPWSAINDYYTVLAASLLRDAADQALWAADDYGMAEGSGFAFSRYIMEQTSRVTYSGERVASLLRTGSTGTEDMEGGTWAFAEQFDLTTGQQLHFADFFTGLSSDAQALVLAKVKEAAKDTVWAGEGALLERHYDPERFYLTDDAFVVFYNPGELVTASGVPVEFSISYDLLGEAWIGWE